MADPTGSVTSVSPTSGSTYLSGATVPVTAAASVTIPGAGTGVPKIYRVNISVVITNWSDCTQVGTGLSYTKEYTQTEDEQTYVVPPTSQPFTTNVSGDGSYLVTATLTSSEKTSSGYGPDVVLGSQRSSFQIGNVGCSPAMSRCTGNDTPLVGCIPQAPADNAKIAFAGGNIAVRYGVVCIVRGNNTCTSRYKFKAKLTVTGPGGLVASFPAEKVSGAMPWSDVMPMQLLIQSAVGTYSVTLSLAVQRVDPNTPPACQGLVITYNPVEWQFEVVDNSSSSSSSSTNSSSSSSTNSSSSSSTNSSSSSSLGQ